MLNQENQNEKNIRARKNSENVLQYLWSLFFIEKNNHAGIQFFRYIFVGGIATCFDFSTLYILTELIHLHYLISAGLGFLVGLTINYCLSIVWVFNNRNVQNRKLEFLIFMIIGVTGLLLTEFSIWAFTELIGFHYLISKIFSAILILIFNFGMRKILLFR